MNTDKDVFKVGDLYYMCYQGVWFVGEDRDGPVGSRELGAGADLPDPRQLAVASRHLRDDRRDDDDDEWVTYAAAAGYTGMMVAWGCTVWGTGWYYPPYCGYGGFYPYYYPHFPTYGYSAWYNPWTGAYGRSAGVYGPYGGAGVGARYNPRTGTYARGAAAYGPYGARGVAQAYNPRTGTYAQTRQGSNVYGSWGSTSVQRGDDWAKTNRYTNNRTGTTTRTIRTDEGAAVTRGERAAGGSPSVTAATSTPATTGTSIAGRTARGRSTTTAAGPTPTGNHRGEAHADDRSPDHTPGADDETARRRSQHDESAQSRCRGAPRGHAAHERQQHLPEQPAEQQRRRELPRWRLARRRRPASITRAAQRWACEMTRQDPRQNVAEFIESAITELSIALVQLDRMAVHDKSSIGWVAHAMNNYLSVTEATLDLIGDALKDHPNREVATWIEGLRHLDTLMHHAVGGLLRASTPAEFPLKFEHVNLPVLMERACDYYRPSAANKHLQIVCRAIGDVPLAWADRVAVAVVADNLLSNAIKFSKPGGEIVVQIMPGPGGVVCSVRDHGPGLTPLEQSRLFLPGTTVGPAPTAGEPSTGFGLAIAKEFVDRMDGRVWSESEPGQGACISFRLPYHAEGLLKTADS